MKSRLQGAGYLLAFALLAFLNFGPGWTARNGSGVYTVPNTFTSGGTITAASHNQNWSDLANELTNSVAADGQTSMTGPLRASNGTASAPSLTFASDTDSGVYRIGANNVGVAVGGTKIVDVSSTGVDVTGSITQGGVAIVPAGTIMSYAGNAAPGGYLLANGQAVSRTTYSALFTVIGTTYGAGDGSTTFNLPDLRGRMAAGPDNMGGVTAAGRIAAATSFSLGLGGENKTIAQANLPNVSLSGTPDTASLALANTVGGIAAIGLAGNATGDLVSGPTGGATLTSYGSSRYGAIDNHTVTFPTSTVPLGGSGTALNILPPLLTLNVIIKY